MQDRIFQHEQNIKPFQFDSRVAHVFDDMIRRSVPGYEEVHALQAHLIPLLLPNGFKIIDLGCSTGKLWSSLREQLDPSVYVGVDPSEAMLEKARSLDSQVEWRCEDALDTDLSAAGVVVVNYTLQFLPIEKRDELLARIYDSLPIGGFLFLSEKLKHEYLPVHLAEIAVHERYKSRQGYTDLEIRQKRDALEDVLIPETLGVHLERLEKCGFDGVEIAYKWLNFCGLMAWKK
jgi:tRNA (cmo5U34)-methyltransferase